MTLGQAKIPQAVSMKKKKRKSYVSTQQKTLFREQQCSSQTGKIFAKLTARKRLTSRREKNSFKPNVFKWSKELSRRLTLNQKKIQKYQASIQKDAEHHRGECRLKQQ